MIFNFDLGIIKASDGVVKRTFERAESDYEEQIN
jgi:hypothetical protein